jgi:hypothetical protein
MSRRMDSEFEGMISEDHSAPANLPQNVIHKYYSKCEYMGGYELDDTIEGLDDTRDDDIDMIERNHSKVKY